MDWEGGLGSGAGLGAGSAMSSSREVSGRLGDLLLNRRVESEDAWSILQDFVHDRCVLPSSNAVQDVVGRG